MHVNEEREARRIAATIDPAAPLLTGSYCTYCYFTSAGAGTTGTQIAQKGPLLPLGGARLYSASRAAQASYAGRHADGRAAL